MDKYTKSLLMVIKIPIGIFLSVLGVAFIGVSIWVSTFSDVASMLLLAALFSGGALVNFGIGYAFLGDEYKATHIVRNGNTMFEPVASKKFLQRRMVVTFVGFIAYVLLAVYYVVRAILVGVYADYLESIDFNASMGALIVFAVLACVVAFCLLMVYKKTRHIDLSEEQEE